ncbi:MAG: glycosyltransferase family 1 protein [Patescibacteria group bacterium]
MKIAIDTGPLESGDSVRGIGVHTKLLLENLEKLKDLKVEAVDVRKVDLGKYDLVHYQKFHPYFFSVPFRKIKPSVLTIHDLIYLIYPKHYPPGVMGKLKFPIQKFFVKNIDAIITISETSKKDIVRFLGIPAEKIHVAYLAPREIFRKLEMSNPLRGENYKLKIAKRYGLPERFVLYVGDVNYNKNLLGLVKACKIAKVPLVIVGKQATSTDFDRNHPENKPLVELLNTYGNDKNVIRLGFIDDSELVGVYNLAGVYCQPSFYEGFGLPVLEAFASGCPVVAAKTQALVEIADPACIFANPKDPKDIADKISMVLEDKELRDQLVETGMVFVKNYSWAKTAKETAEVYKKVLSK